MSYSSLRVLSEMLSFLKFLELSAWMFSLFLREFVRMSSDSIMRMSIEVNSYAYVVIKNYLFYLIM